MEENNNNVYEIYEKYKNASPEVQKQVEDILRNGSADTGEDLNSDPYLSDPYARETEIREERRTGASQKIAQGGFIGGLAMIVVGIILLLCAIGDGGETQISAVFLGAGILTFGLLVALGAAHYIKPTK